jgi:hypothetical protein
MFTVQELKDYIESALREGSLTLDSHLNIDGAGIVEIDHCGGELYLNSEHQEDDDEDAIY